LTLNINRLPAREAFLVDATPTTPTQTVDSGLAKFPVGPELDTGPICMGRWGERFWFDDRAAPTF